MSKISLLKMFVSSMNYTILNDDLKTNVDEVIAKLKLSQFDDDTVSTRVIHLSIERYLPLCLNIAEYIGMATLDAKHLNGYVYEKLIDIYLYNLLELGNAIDYLHDVVDWIHSVSALDKDFIKSESMIKFIMEFYNNHNISIGLEYTDEMDVVYVGILNRDLACIVIL